MGGAADHVGARATLGDQVARAGHPQITRLAHAERRSAMPPHALGAAIEVPFICRLPASVELETGAIAPPGANTSTPSAPSTAGPRDDHV